MNAFDEATITVESGSGGRGCVSFRRERSIPRGGPDGGDGGRGGDVIFQVSSGKRTLQQFQFQKHLKADSGKPGLGKNKTGKSGVDLVIQIPPGTIVCDAETGGLICDLSQPGEAFVVAKGGRGGQGNSRFKSATHQAPRFAQSGESGASLLIKLELKLIADVGIIGMPNAGKSTLISSISSAHPKIASYPFTTLIPNLGVVRTDYGDPFVIADIPGLIPGAHRGAGLGIKFLKHIERTRILVHLVDSQSINCSDPLNTYHAINNELRAYSVALSEKAQILVVNKLDLPGADLPACSFREAVDHQEVHMISALTGEGIEQLLSRIIQTLDQ